MPNDFNELLIRLDSKMDLVLDTLKKLPEMEKRISNLEKNDGIKQEQITTVKAEVEKLRNTNTTWSFVNSIAIIVSSILGISIK